MTDDSKRTMTTKLIEIDGDPPFTVGDLRAFVLECDHRRPRLPCGCRPGRPGRDCAQCQRLRLLSEVLERAKMKVMREMHPEWRLPEILRAVAGPRT